MCQCKNIEIGSYGNQVQLTAPFTTKPICVDRCLEEEILYLWSIGIETTGCCCGHNWGDELPYIGVIDRDIPRMQKMGYEYHHNKCRPDDKDSFIPKFSIGLILNPPFRD